MRGYYAAHREALLIKQRQYRARNVEALNARQRERVTGFSPELVDKTLAHQEGKCAICLDPLRLKSLHRDHCHTTGKPRGLLCMRCNTALGKFKDNVRTLARAIAYLKHPPVERLKGKT